MVFTSPASKELLQQAEMSQLLPATSEDGLGPKPSSQSHPRIVEKIRQALQALDAADKACSVKLDLGCDGVLQRDEPGFDKLLSSPRRY
jgi:hypothetical protein